MKGISLRSALRFAVLAIVFPAASQAQQTSDHSRDVEAKIRYCKTCHGRSAQGLAAAVPVPRLAGQTIAYIEAKFGIISERKRDNPTAEKFMVPVLGSVDPAIRRAVATHLNSLDPPPNGVGPREFAPAGKKIYEAGVPEAGVQPCATCHGTEAKGAEAIPRLAGQIYPYAVKVLRNWATINRERGRNPGDVSAVKAADEHKLTDEQIVAVAAYLSDLR